MVEAEKVLGFVCPHCRLLFSEKMENLGAEVACPSCHSRLGIPSVDELQGVRGIQLEASDKQEGEGISLKRVECTNWLEEEPAEIAVLRVKEMPWRMLIPAMVLGVLAVVSLWKVLLVEAPSASENLVVQVQGEDQNLTTSLAAIEFAEEDAQQLLDQLHGCKSIAQLIQLCRPTKDLREKMESFYGREPVEFSKVRKMLKFLKTSESDDLYTVAIETADGQNRVIALTPLDAHEGSDRRLVLDWESFVGYCEIPWEELLEQRPAKPVMVRVHRTASNIYAGEYNAKEWRAYQLKTVGHSKALIGYVRKNSLEGVRIEPLAASRSQQAMTLRVHFPVDAIHADVVEIDEVVSKNWFIESKQESYEK